MQKPQLPPQDPSSLLQARQRVSSQPTAGRPQYHEQTQPTDLSEILASYSPLSDSMPTAAPCTSFVDEEVAPSINMMARTDWPHGSASNAVPLDHGTMQQGQGWPSRTSLPQSCPESAAAAAAVAAAVADLHKPKADGHVHEAAPASVQHAATTRDDTENSADVATAGRAQGDPAAGQEAAMSGADVLSIPRLPTARRAAQKPKYADEDFIVEDDSAEDAPSPRARRTKGTRPVRSTEEAREELKQWILSRGMFLTLFMALDW